MRIYTYLFIMVGLMALLSLAGISTASGYILNYMNPLSPENYQSSEFYAKILGIFALTGVGMYLGYIFRVNPESYIVTTMAGLLILFVADIFSVMIYIKQNSGGQEWLGYAMMVFLFPVAVGYTISLVSWWRGISD